MRTIIAIAAALQIAAVTSTQSRVEYTGDGSTTAFAYTFPTQSGAWIDVYLDGAKQSAGFTVSVNANQATSPGGNVTFTAAPASSAAVRIERSPPLKQESVWTQYSMKPGTVEKQLDRLVMQVQEVDRRVADAEAQATHDFVTVVGTINSSYDLVMFFPGTLLPNQVLARVAFPRVVSFPENAFGSAIGAGIASTGSTILTLARNGELIGSITITPGSAALLMDATTFNPGDILTVTAPALADATLADISLTLAGTLP